MKNILDQLFYGELDPHSELLTALSGHSEQLRAARNELLSQLNASQLRTWERVEDAVRLQTAVCAKEAFYSGFSLGAQLILETLTD